MLAVHSRCAEPNPDPADVGVALDWMPAECAAFGHGDYRPSTVVACRADGTAMSNLKYVWHSVCKGALRLAGMPCVCTADETLTVTLKDRFSDIAVI